MIIHLYELFKNQLIIIHYMNKSVYYKNLLREEANNLK